MVTIIPNPDKEKYERVSQAVINNDGYCPCLIKKDQDTKCMCKEFRDAYENGVEGECRCGRFIVVKE